MLFSELRKQYQLKYIVTVLRCPEVNSDKATVLVASLLIFVARELVPAPTNFSSSLGARYPSLWAIPFCRDERPQLAVQCIQTLESRPHLNRHRHLNHLFILTSFSITSKHVVYLLVLLSQ